MLSPSDYVDEIRSLLHAVGVPDVLDEPEVLSTLDDDRMAKLVRARDLAVEAAEKYPESGEVVDQLYMAHMTYTTARYLHAVLASGDPVDVPTPAEIKRVWDGEELRPYDASEVRELIIPSASATLLTSCGLPEDAEPFVSFDSHIQRLADAEQLTSTDDDEEYLQYFNAYWRIGATEDDDPICIDERADGVVVVLDRDWGFFSMQYMNSSVGHLLLTLQAYADMLGTVDPQAMAESWPDIVISDEARATFRAVVEAIDPGAMSEGSWWEEALRAT